ncbi:hypothetical protein [Dyadobacter sp. CY326]|uniref:hypothetical protein n=1 Tax=Dyadobacter sp. CY326 TaxID=2907300 RepID=UPI001F381012|nr:hypothetical protein [Dyadobacter sp. CY326]MCE7065948.1 hypothetical protein [Dyadobacter sp. CY326]
MQLLSLFESPFKIQLSFAKLIDEFEARAADPSHSDHVRAKALLADIAPFPEFRTGITDSSQIRNNAPLLKRLFADYFPAALTLNEIKAVNIPYTGIIFNHTQRLRNILDAAGAEFEINIRDFNDAEFYIFSCCMILNSYYGTRLDFGRPLFYDIPTAKGITRHYRIMYNGDSMDITPSERALPITQADLDLLIDNYNNLELWKEKFPPESWMLTGFSIMTLFDATVENAVSTFKEKLLGLNADDFRESVESIFQSIYQIEDIHVGFTLYNAAQKKFQIAEFGREMNSYILPKGREVTASELLCSYSYNCLIDERNYFAVSDTVEFLNKFPDSHFVRHFDEQGFKSFIVAPVVKNDVLLGVLEVVSPDTKKLNSINANKLDVVMPFLTDTVERLVAQVQNQIRAVIQEKFTTLHPSVYWKFETEAEQLIHYQQAGATYALKEIVFENVFPMYGQIDIKGSSDARNTSATADLQRQVRAALQLLEAIERLDSTKSFETAKQELRDYLGELHVPIIATTEQHIRAFLDSDIHSHFRQVTDPLLLPGISQYFEETNTLSGSFHDERRKYERTIAIINNSLSNIIDESQKEAQLVFPHYYERFKTDGVEHNLYIGASISPFLPFYMEHLHALRFWQLEVLCKMEIAHHHKMNALPYPLDVTTLILVYHEAISIRFRMDEKRFDVDGSYNARFEIVKKRIDKACIKHTNERITKAGKVTIVYSNEAEVQEYKGYIATLQSAKLLETDVEQFEVEDLQGVTGLRALRVGIAH